MSRLRDRRELTDAWPAPARTASRVLRWVACCVLVTAALVACGGEGEGGSGERPSFSPTASPDLPTPSGSLDRPSPTRSRTPPQSASSDAAEPPPPPEEETTPAPVESPEQSEVPESSPTPESGDGTADAEGADADATPTWVWWLIGIAVVAIVSLVAWLLARSRRRKAWLAGLEDVEAEVDWFAHTLLPALRHSGSLEQLVGGWRVGAARVAAVEDRLTVLESSAPHEQEGARARALRDAVRLARGRMERLATPGPHDSWALHLDETIAGLDAALGPSATATRS